MISTKNTRTDLALEVFDGSAGAFASRSEKRACECGEFLIEEIIVEHPDAARRLGKNCGKYITVSSPVKIHELSVYDSLLLSEIISGELRSFKCNGKCATVAGLGNRNMTADSLGVRTAEMITPTRAPDMSGKGITTVIPGVQASTGISAPELLIPLLAEIGSSLTILVDSLAAKDPERLGKTVQLTNTGISPGSGLGRRAYALNRETLGTDVISLGVPTVIAADDIIRSISDKNAGCFGEGLILGMVDCDILTEAAARVLAVAVEKAFSE